MKPSDVEQLTTTVGKVFLEHHVQNLFGIILLHHPFSLHEDEMLVNIESVAVTWKPSSLAQQQLRDVKGSSWRFTDKGLAPYEFVHDTATRPSIDGFQPFVSELREVLEHLGLADKLGLCAFTRADLDATTQVEFTQDRANISLPFDIAPEQGQSKSTEGSLAIRTVSRPVVGPNPTPIVLKKCKIACNVRSEHGPL